MNPTPLHPTCRPLAALLALALASITGNVAAQALTPAFTYQGELRLSSGPATAPFDMQFRLYNAQAGGSQIGATITATSVAVSGGLFSVPLDFGPAQFAGERQWLEIAIRPAGGGAYETLSPRTELTAAPYAWGAAVALANSVTTTSIVDGTVGTTDIDATQVQRRVTGTCPAGQYVRIVAQDGSVTCGTDATSGGTVTSIATGAGLAGGPITATGTISVAAGGIGTTEINAAEVQRRVTGSCAAGNYVRQVNQDGTVVCEADATGPAAWRLDGNAGTNPAANFIGTTDLQPFVVRTANARSLRIEPSSITFGSPALPITTNTIGGSHANEVTAGVRGATIGGGGVPIGNGDPDLLFEGPNRVTDAYGTVGGGYRNRAGDAAGTTTDRISATVGGGSLNSASGGESTVGGGTVNTASGVQSTVGGGSLNSASGFASTVSGGTDNCAGGVKSWAGGQRAKVRPGTGSGAAGDGCAGVASTATVDGDGGTFVWADSQSADFVSTGSNQFLVRAQGGIFFGTNSTVSIPAGRFINTSTGAHLTTGGTWTNASSRTFKSDFAAVDPADVLRRVLRLGITTWAYRDSTEGRHIGPIAEEFHALFGLGGDDRSISTVDADGVALAAIQGLNAKLEAENAALRAESAELRAELDRRDAAYRDRFERLEAMLVGRGIEER
jgi:hypothetical protein